MTAVLGDALDAYKNPVDSSPRSADDDWINTQPRVRRQALNGILFRMRSGCQWEQLPRKFGPKSTVHDWFQRWCAGGVMERIWAALIEGCDELGGVDWKWQSADASLGKARFGGEKGGQESHGSWQDGHQEVDGRRWPRGPAGGGDCRCQRA